MNGQKCIAFENGRPFYSQKMATKSLSVLTVLCRPRHRMLTGELRGNLRLHRSTSKESCRGEDGEWAVIAAPAERLTSSMRKRTLDSR